MKDFENIGTKNPLICGQYGDTLSNVSALLTVLEQLVRSNPTLNEQAWHGVFLILRILKQAVEDGI